MSNPYFPSALTTPLPESPLGVRLRDLRGTAAHVGTVPSTMCVKHHCSVIVSASSFLNFTLPSSDQIFTPISVKLISSIFISSPR